MAHTKSMIPFCAEYATSSLAVDAGTGSACLLLFIKNSWHLSLHFKSYLYQKYHCSWRLRSFDTCKILEKHPYRTRNAAFVQNPKKQQTPAILSECIPFCRSYFKFIKQGSRVVCKTDVSTLQIYICNNKYIDLCRTTWIRPDLDVKGPNKRYGQEFDPGPYSLAAPPLHREKTDVKIRACHLRNLIKSD